MLSSITFAQSTQLSGLNEEQQASKDAEKMLRVKSLVT